MSRLPPQTRDQLPPDEAEAHDAFADLANRAFGPNGEKFVYQDSKGAYIGPMPFFIASKQTGLILRDLLVSLSKFPLLADARETAIMAVGGYFQAGYETYSHIPQAIEVGLTREQAEVLAKDGGKPSGLNEGCSAAYDVARYLLTTKGPLSQQLWDKAVALFGKEGILGLLNYIGCYCYVSVALNAVDAPVPE